MNVAREIFQAELGPSAELDSFYTDEVFPVEFLDLPFPKESITEKNAKQIPDQKTRSLWEDVMNAKKCAVRVSELRAVGALAVDVCTSGTPVLQFIVSVNASQTYIALSVRNDEMKNHLPEHLWDSLMHRSLHWILRQHLSKFPNPSVKKGLLWLLYQAHANNSQWYDVYDASVLRAKFLLRTVSPNGDGIDNPSHALIKVGEALEGIRHYQHAAPMYREASALASPDFPPEHTECKAALLHYAGLALKRAQEYPDALSAYLEGFFLSLEGVPPSSFDPNKSPLNSRLKDLAIFYESWINDQQFGLDGANMEASKKFDSWKKDEYEGNILEVSKAFYPLLALLHAAGWNTGGESVYFGIGEGMYRAGVLVAMYNKPKARKALYKAFRSSDATEFQNFLLGLCNQELLKTISSGTQPVSKKEAKKGEKARARDVMQSGNRPNAPCDYCKMWSNDHMRCPCRTVLYCGKECQVAHWKAGHKDVCPTRKNKTK